MTQKKTYLQWTTFRFPDAIYFPPITRIHISLANLMKRKFTVIIPTIKLFKQFFSLPQSLVETRKIFN